MDLLVWVAVGINILSVGLNLFAAWKWMEARRALLDMLRIRR